MKTAISQNLKRLRKVKELTQHELASLAGVCQSEISRIENGQLSPTLKTIQRLAQALGQKPENLMDGMHKDEYKQLHSLDNVLKCKKDKAEKVPSNTRPKWATDTERELAKIDLIQDKDDGVRNLVSNLVCFVLGIPMGALVHMLAQYILSL